jgi:hypothetical protein
VGRTLSQTLVLEVELLQEVLLTAEALLLRIDTGLARKFTSLALSCLSVSEVSIVALRSAVFAVQERKFRVWMALGAACAAQVLTLLTTGRARLALEVLEEGAGRTTFIALLVVQNH